MSSSVTSLPSVEDALPGRSEVMKISGRHVIHGRNMLVPFPDDCEVIQFGMGCFWGAERKFWSLPGVYSTAVGYAAGVTPNPTYQEVCSGMTGHNETVLVIYQPAEISIQQLLKLFWESHDPTQGLGGHVNAYLCYMAYFITLRAYIYLSSIYICKSSNSPSNIIS